METMSTRVKRMCSNITTISFMMTAIAKIFIICGLALLTVGTIGLITCSRYSLMVRSIYFEASSLAVAAAVIIIFTAILGDYGANTQNFKVFVGYIALLLAVMIFNIVIMVDMSEPFVAENVRDFSTNNLSINEKKAWDKIQSELQCCGKYGPGDWGVNIPLSCCLPFPAGATSFFECTRTSAHYIGCLTALWLKLDDLTLALTVTAAVVTCLQMLSLPIVGWVAYRMKFAQETPYKNLSDPLTSAMASNNPKYQSIPGLTDVHNVL